MVGCRGQLYVALYASFSCSISGLYLHSLSPLKWLKRKSEAASKAVKALAKWMASPSSLVDPQPVRYDPVVTTVQNSSNRNNSDNNNSINNGNKNGNNTNICPLCEKHPRPVVTTALFWGGAGTGKTAVAEVPCYITLAMLRAPSREYYIGDYMGDYYTGSRTRS